MNHRFSPNSFTAFCLLLIVAIPAAHPLAAATTRERERTRREAALVRKAQELSQAFAIVTRRIRPAVVNIQVERTETVGRNYNNPFELFDEFFRRRFPRRKRTTGQGSGVIVDRRGYILTNNHVVGDADTIVVKLHDGREVTAELVGTDPDSDVAVIRINTHNLIVAPMGNSDNCQVGEFVLAIGNPFGLESTVTSGIISARGRSGVGIVAIEDFIQTDAAINPGNSGGPLVNLKGQVIGINTAIYSKSGGYQGIGFAIPINIARTIMQGIIANKKRTSSYLGLRVMGLNVQIAKQFGLESTLGALVTEVLAHTPAARAGLRTGDVITHYGKRKIRDDQQLRNLVATTSPGKKIDIVYIRRGNVKKTTVTVEAIPKQVMIAKRSKKILDTLGIEIAELTPKLRRRLGYEEKAWGVLVVRVTNPETIGMGIRPGSLILKVNDIEVRQPQKLLESLAAADPQKGVSILWRTGRYLLGPVKLVFKK